MNNRILTALSRMRCPVPETLPCRLQLKMAQPGQIVCLQDYPVTEMMLLVRGELLIEAQFATGDSLISQQKTAFLSWEIWSCFPAG